MLYISSIEEMSSIELKRDYHKDQKLFHESGPLEYSYEYSV
jgi:hypothetical protein